MPGGVGAFAPDPATGTEAGPGPTTPRRSAVRRASRLRGRAHASQAWRRALLRDTYQGWTSLGAPPIPSLGGRQRRREKEGRKNPDAKRAGRKETGLFDMVNRKRRGRRIGQRLERHRVNGNALVSRPSARLGVPFVPIASVPRSRYIGSGVAIAGRVSHARGTAEYRRRDQAVGRAAEEASLTSTRRARAWRS